MVSILVWRIRLLVLLLEHHQQRLKAYGELYRRRHRAKLSEYRKAWVKMNPGYQRNRKRREVAALSDHYIKSKIAEATSLRFRDVDEALVVKWRARIVRLRSRPGLINTPK